MSGTPDQFVRDLEKWAAKVENRLDDVVSEASAEAVEAAIAATPQRTGQLKNSMIAITSEDLVGEGPIGAYQAAKTAKAGSQVIIGWRAFHAVPLSWSRMQFSAGLIDSVRNLWPAITEGVIKRISSRR